MTDDKVFTAGTKNNVLLEGPVGNIEVKLSIPKNPLAYYMIICHPNSIQGGSMDNKVVTTIERGCNKLGIPTIRFNFRGVGASEGKYDEGSGEQEDLQAVIQWANKKLPESKLLLAGFSFGSYVTYSVVNNQQTSAFICVGPAVNMVHYSFDNVPNCPWVIMHAEDDEVAPFKDVVDWHEGLANKPDLIAFKEASHFFHGKLIALQDEIMKFLHSIVS